MEDLEKSTNETTFENARVGDRVWDNKRKEYGEITAFCADSDLALMVRFPSDLNGYHLYHLNGKRRIGEEQTLFWDKLVIPARPKRAVQKTKRVYVNLLKYGVGGIIYLYNSEFEAKREVKNPESYHKIAYPVDIPYEVEE